MKDRMNEGPTLHLEPLVEGRLAELIPLVRAHYQKVLASRSRFEIDECEGTIRKRLPAPPYG